MPSMFRLSILALGLFGLTAQAQYKPAYSDAELKLKGKKGACFTLREPGHRQGGSYEENLPKLEKPEGVSDADWAIYKTMRDAAFETQDHARLRSFWTQKPEGMTDAGYQTLVKALREHLGHRGGNRSGDRKKGRRGPR